MTLEIETGKVPGTVVRRTPASRPAIAGALILGLFIVQMIFLVLVSLAIWQDMIADPKKHIPDAHQPSAHGPAIRAPPAGPRIPNEHARPPAHHAAAQPPASRLGPRRPGAPPHVGGAGAAGQGQQKREQHDAYAFVEQGFAGHHEANVTRNSGGLEDADHGDGIGR